MDNHPIWSAPPYKVFLYTPNDVQTRVEYVKNNPIKEGLTAQKYDFVTPYNNWPFHKK
ncbi:MAG TPA: hypothetical protein VL992_03320 [Tepidisphaeraceae bacterium]|nr:hypothetical protein [Tepidisphaeraceae bacterium]